MPSLTDILEILFDAAVMVPVIVLLTRIVGLRSFSKMSGYDFAITVAMGSILASVVVGGQTGVITGILALVALFAVQTVLSRARVSSDAVEEVMGNAPLLLMDGATILHDNLAAAKITQADLMGKLREANCLRLSDVNCVVFEPTGDVSVLHGGDMVDAELLEGVRRSA